MRGNRAYRLLAWALVASAGCSRSDEEPGSGKIRACVSILPQAYFVERIGGDRVDVMVLAGPGQSHETYEPTPKQMARLSEADVFFRIGVPFEKSLLNKIARIRGDLRVVDTREGIALRRMEAQHRHEGEEEPGSSGASGAGPPDPHTWLDPLLVKVQARAICEELCRCDPERAEDYRRNLAAFADDLDRAHERIARILAPLAGRAFYVFHPAFGYFADRYGLRQEAIEVEGKEPGAKQLAATIDRARLDGVKVIFVQAQFSTRAAERVAEAIGGTVARVDPLARDYLENLDRIAVAFEQALREQRR